MFQNFVYLPLKSIELLLLGFFFILVVSHSRNDKDLNRKQSTVLQSVCKE